MNGRFDPTALNGELLAAGIPRASFVGCRSGTRSDQDGTDDVTQIIDWAQGHPTPGERATAQAVLLRHDRDRRRRDRGIRLTRIAELEARILTGLETAEEARELRRLEIERNAT